MASFLHARDLVCMEQEQVDGLCFKAVLLNTVQSWCMHALGGLGICCHEPRGSGLYKKLAVRFVLNCYILAFAEDCWFYQ